MSVAYPFWPISTEQLAAPWGCHEERARREGGVRKHTHTLRPFGVYYNAFVSRKIREPACTGQNKIRNMRLAQVRAKVVTSVPHAINWIGPGHTGPTTDIHSKVKSTRSLHNLLD